MSSLCKLIGADEMFISVDKILLTLLRLHPEKYRKNSQDVYFLSVEHCELDGK